MSDSIDVTEKLKTVLNNQYALKTKIKNVVSDLYPLNLGTNFESYGAEINKLYGTDICGMNAADAMYPWCHPEINMLQNASANLNDTFIRQTQYSEQGAPDCPLHKLNRRNAGGQVSFPGVKELRIKNIDKFTFWFAGLSCESLYFPDLERIEYSGKNPDYIGGTYEHVAFPNDHYKTGAFRCSVFAPKLKYLSDNFFNNDYAAGPGWSGSWGPICHSEFFVDMNIFFTSSGRNFEIGTRISPYVRNATIPSVYGMIKVPENEQESYQDDILDASNLSAFYPTLTNGQESSYVIPRGNKTSIGKCAFNGFYKLEDITIPDTITRIESLGLAGCLNLIEFTVPSSVEYIGERAFSSLSFSRGTPKTITVEGKTMAEVKAMENYPWGVAKTSKFICTDGTLTYS